VFVLLSPSSDRKGTFASKIYHPNGELWYAGPLVPRPPGATVLAQRNQFEGLDGERLIMTRGRWLQSVKPKRGGVDHPR